MFPKAPCKIKFLKSIKKMFPNGLAIPGIAYTQYVFFHDLEVLWCREHMEAGSEDQVRDTSLKPSVGRARHRAVWRVLERWLLAPQLGPALGVGHPGRGWSKSPRALWLLPSQPPPRLLFCPQEREELGPGRQLPKSSFLLESSEEVIPSSDHPTEPEWTVSI